MSGWDLATALAARSARMPPERYIQAASLVANDCSTRGAAGRTRSTAGARRHSGEASTSSGCLLELATLVRHVEWFDRGPVDDALAERVRIDSGRVGAELLRIVRGWRSAAGDPWA